MAAEEQVIDLDPLGNDRFGFRNRRQKAWDFAKRHKGKIGLGVGGATALGLYLANKDLVDERARELVPSDTARAVIGGAVPEAAASAGLVMLLNRHGWRLTKKIARSAREAVGKKAAPLVEAAAQFQRKGDRLAAQAFANQAAPLIRAGKVIKEIEEKAAPKPLTKGIVIPTTIGAGLGAWRGLRTLNNAEEEAEG